MGIEECMQKHTHRQYLVWSAWLLKQWSKPSRNDYYLMQVWAAVKGIFRKHEPDINEGKIPFEPKQVAPPKSKYEVEQEKVGWAKAIWRARIKRAKGE